VVHHADLQVVHFAARVSRPEERGCDRQSHHRDVTRSEEEPLCGVDVYG